MARTIGEVASEIGMSADTLRYYERIRLLPASSRTAGGKRLYYDRDVARLRFIQRAKSVGFSLDEVAKLLRFRENPGESSRAVREIAAKKHAHVHQQLALLRTVEAELALLLKICRGDSDTCPILTTLERGSRIPKRRKRPGGGGS